jgi:predicted TIM-barrel fold metal-dependent hydrolase
MASVIAKPIISADSHVTEPADMYRGRIEKKFEATAPYMICNETGGEVFIIEGMKDPFPMTLAAAAGRRGKEMAHVVFEKMKDCHRGGLDPKQRLIDQDNDGVFAEVLYPSLGMFLCNHPDPEYKSACLRAYNDWLVEYCATSPKRLIGLGQIAMNSPLEGIKEMERVKQQGLRGIMMPGSPLLEDYDSKIYDPFWQAAVEMDMPLSFHILTYKNGVPKPRGPKLNIFIEMIRGNQDILGTLVFGGVFERHPKLKVVCAEADAGWVPHFVYRMDHAVDRNPVWLGDVKLSRKPSEYFYDNVYLTFQDDLTAFQLKELFNKEHMLWASDFPHQDSTWPHSQQVLADHTSLLTQKEAEQILHDNVSKLYGLEI